MCFDCVPILGPRPLASSIYVELFWHMLSQSAHLRDSRMNLREPNGVLGHHCVMAMTLYLTPWHQAIANVISCLILRCRKFFDSFYWNESVHWFFCNLPSLEQNRLVLQAHSGCLYQFFFFFFSWQDGTSLPRLLVSNYTAPKLYNGFTYARSYNLGSTMVATVSLFSHICS